MSKSTGSCIRSSIGSDIRYNTFHFCAYSRNRRFPGRRYFRLCLWLWIRRFSICRYHYICCRVIKHAWRQSCKEKPYNRRYIHDYNIHTDSHIFNFFSVAFRFYVFCATARPYVSNSFHIGLHSIFNKVSSEA